MTAALQIGKRLFALLAISCLPAGHAAYGSEETELSRHFSTAAGHEASAVDHAPWNSLLANYLHEQDGVNLFRYSAVTHDDLVRLSDYIEYLQSLRVTELTPAQQFAYWINLYNAVTVQVILDHYPVESIRDISYSLLSRGPWKEQLVLVEGFALSLDDIEHGILRPRFQDSRIHYAVNCASISCPNLQDRAFTASNLEVLLETAAEEYVNSYRGAEVLDGELVLSSIYDWYAEDFGGSDEAVIDHLLDYAGPGLAVQLEGFGRIDRYRYDWNLNE